jgi:plasmid stabilization system protein ParE
MTFQVELTPVAEIQIEQSYQWYRDRSPEFTDRWFRGLMNTIATLQEKPQRCTLAVEHEIFRFFLKKFANCFLGNLRISTKSFLRFWI